MSSKANGKTYEKANKKNVKLQDMDTNSIFLSHNSAPTRISLSDDYSLIAAEVARLINPVIETTISKAIDKLQEKNSDISGKLSTHDKLKIFLTSGARIFSDPGEASAFTSQLEKINIGNLVTETKSNSKFSSPPPRIKGGRYMRILAKPNSLMTRYLLKLRPNSGPDLDLHCLLEQVILLTPAKRT
ncbi:hypothetical protein XELAEV_18001989mg [Xenopus laevis]|nr:hypothetical protein XELAEV_18001989mg [Xenopus laevis]